MATDSLKVYIDIGGGKGNLRYYGKGKLVKSDIDFTHLLELLWRMEDDVSHNPAASVFTAEMLERMAYNPNFRLLTLSLVAVELRRVYPDVFEQYRHSNITVRFKEKSKKKALRSVYSYSGETLEGLWERVTLLPNEDASYTAVCHERYEDLLEGTVVWSTSNSTPPPFSSYKEWCKQALAPLLPFIC